MFGATMANDDKQVMKVAQRSERMLLSLRNLHHLLVIISHSCSKHVGFMTLYRNPAREAINYLLNIISVFM